MLFTRDKSFYRDFFSMFSILVMQNIIVFGISLVDNIMVGGYSEISLSGVAAVNQIQFFFQCVTAGAADTLLVMGSQYWGENRTEPIKQLMKIASVVAFSIGLLLFAVSSLYPRQLLGLFTDSAVIITEGMAYLSVFRFTFLIFPLTMVLYAMLRSVQVVKIAFYISFLSLVIDCGLNYIFIYGHFGTPALGAEGAAIGTLVARIAELVIIILYIQKTDRRLSFKLSDLFSFDSHLARDFMKTGWYVMAIGAMFGLSTGLQTVILGHLSDSAIAANSVAATLFQTLKVASIGAASAACVIIGKAVGRGDASIVREYSKTLQCIFLIIGILTGTLLFILRMPILSLYDLSDEAYKLASSFILVFCLTSVGTAYQMPTLTGIVRGGGDVKFVMYNDLISIWCIVIPFSLLAAFVWHWPPVAVVFCLNSDQIFKCIAAAIKCNRYHFIKKLTN